MYVVCTREDILDVKNTKKNRLGCGRRVPWCNNHGNIFIIFIIAIGRLWSWKEKKQKFFYIMKWRYKNESLTNKLCIKKIIWIFHLGVYLVTSTHHHFITFWCCIFYVIMHFEIFCFYEKESYLLRRRYRQLSFAYWIFVFFLDIFI